MIKVLTRAVMLTLPVLGAALVRADEGKGAHWPQFRGPAASGIAEGHPLPLKWDVETGEGIRWKTPIAGLGHSSPVVWGDRVFVSTAISADPDPYLRVGLFGESPKNEEKVEHEFRLFCLDKNSGKVLWDRLCTRGVPKVSRHIKATHANCTPATDGKYVIAFFGAEGMFCFDMDGNPRWLKQFEVLDAGPADATDLQWGFASSAVIHDGKIIVQCDARNEAYVAVFDLKSGKGVWKVEREKYPCWGTPTVYAGKDMTQVIVNGYLNIGAYDFATGKQLWKMRGGGDVPVPTPIVAHNLIFITSAHGGQAPVYAVKTSATGEITLPEGQSNSENIAWAHMKIGNYMQTPLVYGDNLYCCRDNGIMACYDARTGKKHYRERLADGVGFTASPVAGDGKLYFTSEEGDVHVIKAGTSFERLAHNKLGEISMATPAISEGALFFRTKDHLIAVGDKPKSDPEKAAKEPAPKKGEPVKPPTDEEAPPE